MERTDQFEDRTGILGKVQGSDAYRFCLTAIDQVLRHLPVGSTSVPELLRAGVGHSEAYIRRLHTIAGSRAGAIGLLGAGVREIMTPGYFWSILVESLGPEQVERFLMQALGEEGAAALTAARFNLTGILDTIPEVGKKIPRF